MGACGFVCPTRARRAQNGKATTGRRRYRESMIRPQVTRPFDMSRRPAGRACPAPTPFLVGARHRLPLAPHAPRVQGRNHAVRDLVNPPLPASPALCRMALSVPTGTSLPSWPGTVTINTLSRMPELISQHSAHFHAWIHYPAASQRWPERYPIEARVKQGQSEGGAGALVRVGPPVRQPSQGARRGSGDPPHIWFSTTLTPCCETPPRAGA